MVTPTDGPFYDDFQVGMDIPPLPPVTLTAADNVWYRALTGDQHMPSLDDRLFARLAGMEGPLINPGLVLQYSVGQTTNASRRAIANLYYRSLRMHRPVLAGDTLSTQTTVPGLKAARPKDAETRGRVWLGMETRSDAGVVASYERCVPLPCGGEAPGHDSDTPGPDEPQP